MLRHPFLSYGFRPLFLAAGLTAALLIPLWILALHGEVAPGGYLMGPLWHGHEMIFGFAGAVLAGFFLTAVPNWTGIPGLKGGGLAALAALWLAARLAILFAAVLPPALVIALDCAFLPLAGAVILAPIVKSRNWRNLGFPPLLMTFGLLDLLVHLGALGLLPASLPISASGALRAAVDAVVLAIVILSGRVVPAFTGNALRLRPRPRNWTDGTAVTLAALLVPLDCLPALRPLSGAVALVAAVVLALRMRGWHSLATRRTPLLWVLHLGHAWLVLGLALKAASDLTGLIPWTTAIHGLTAGAIGTFTLGMMSRVALGHSGRPLVLRPVIVIAYALVSAGALLRLVAPFLPGWAMLPLGIDAAGLSWAAGFAIFTVVYAPILWVRRPDQG